MNNKLFFLNKKRGLILTFLIIFILIMPLYLYKTREGKIDKSKVSPSPLSKETLRVIDVYPARNALKVGLYPEITIVFSRALKNDEFNLVKIITAPPIEGERELSEDNTALFVTPTLPLRTDQKYTLTLSLVDIVYSWNFTTVPVSEVSVEDQIKNQAQADRDFSNMGRETLKNYPWINSLPLQEKNYYVYFDVDKKTFISLLYPQKSSIVSIENQVEGFKKEIFVKLQNLGIDITRYDFEWNINPE